MVRFFKHYSPAVAVVILLLSIFFWFPSGLSAAEQVAGHARPYDLLFGWIFTFGGNKVLQYLAGFVGALVMATAMVQLNIRYFFLCERSYLPAFFLLTITGSFGFVHSISPVHILCICVLAILFKILATYRYEGVAYPLLDSGAIMLVVAVFYSPAILFVPVVWTIQLVIRPFRWKEIIFVLLGIIIPGLLVAGILYVSGSNAMEVYFNNFRPGLSLEIAFTGIEKVFLGVMLVFFILASIHILSSITSRKMHARRVFQVLFVLFVFCILVFLTIPVFTAELVLLAAVPISFLLSDFFIYNSKRRIVRILFIVYFLAVVLVRMAQIPYIQKNLSTWL